MLLIGCRKKCENVEVSILENFFNTLISYQNLVSCVPKCLLHHLLCFFFVGYKPQRRFFHMFFKSVVFISVTVTLVPYSAIISDNLPSAGLLKSPPIPQVGEYFDVIIPSAVSPYNFFVRFTITFSNKTLTRPQFQVQPFESKDKLDRLMTALQERYNNSPCTPPQIEDIQPGKIYVSKHVDNLWYRTSVIKVIHAGSISVFYCDFGYYSNLTRQQLFPLDREFTELPYQAIKAKLVGGCARTKRSCFVLFVYL